MPSARTTHFGPSGWGLRQLLLAAAGLAIPVCGALANKGEAVVLVVVTVMALGCAVADRRLPPSPGRALLAVAALFLGWSALSSSWSPDTGEGLRRVGELAIMVGCGLFLFAWGRALDDRSQGIVGAAAALGTVLGLVAVTAASILTGGSHAKSHFAVLVVLVWPAVLWLYRRGWRRLAVIVPAGLAASALIGGSHAAGLAVLASGPVFLAGALRPRAARLALAATMAVLVVGMPVLVRSGPSWVTFSRDVPYLPNSAYHRYFIWKFTADRIAERPLAGWGIDAARNLPLAKVVVREETPVPWRPSLPVGFTSEAIPLHPHNGSLQIWMELGLAGTLLMLGLLLLPIRGLAAEADRHAVGAGLAAMTAALVISLVSFGAWQSWWFSSLWLGVLAFRPLVARPASAPS